MRHRVREKQRQGEWGDGYRSFMHPYLITSPTSIPKPPPYGPYFYFHPLAIPAKWRNDIQRASNLPPHDVTSDHDCLGGGEGPPPANMGTLLADSAYCRLCASEFEVGFTIFDDSEDKASLAILINKYLPIKVWAAARVFFFVQVLGWSRRLGALWSQISSFFS